MSKAFPVIAGTADIPSQENLLFGNLKHLIDDSIIKERVESRYMSSSVDFS